MWHRAYAFATRITYETQGVPTAEPSIKLLMPWGSCCCCLAIYNLPHENLPQPLPHPLLLCIVCVSALQARNAKTFAIFRYVLRGFINLPATQHAFDLCLIRSSNKLITIIDLGLSSARLWGFNYNNNRNRSISKICIMICK